MLSTLKIRFQPWVMLTITALVIVTAITFLVTVFRTFGSIAEENASVRLSLIAGQAVNQIEHQLQANGRFVHAHARAELSQFVTDSRLNPQETVAGFLASLEADPTLYSHFFGLANEEFLQVIGIRGDERIITALKAPPGTHFAVRRITAAATRASTRTETRTTSDSRIDRYEFLDQQRNTLGSREQEATLVPTSRPWYAATLQRGGLAVTEPYLFASTGELGITVASPLAQNAGALATDISLRSLQDFVGALTLSDNGIIAVQDARGRILALRGKGLRFADLSLAPLTEASKIDHPILAPLSENSADSGSARETRLQTLGASGEKFLVAKRPSATIGGASFTITVLAPLTDFTGAFQRAQRDVGLVSLVLLALLLPLAFAGSRQVATVLDHMATDADHLKKLNFDRAPQRHSSFITEIDSLADAQNVMHDAILKRTQALVSAQGKLENLVQTGLDLGRERDRMALLRKVLFSGKELLQCDAGTLYMVTDHQTLRFAQRTKSDELPSFEIPLYDPAGKPVERFMATWCALHNQPIVVEDVYSETRFDVSGAKKMDAETGYRTISMLTVPLSPRAGEVIGVLQFLNALDPVSGAVIPFSPDLVRFVTAMAAQAAVALDNHQLIEAQKELLDAIIKLLAGAIDAKSPYTGGHCERVPELGIMLAEAACAESTGPLADFRFETDDEWREFRIGAWLHDCGKVTTPEYVVDKSSKLETIYNRLHEVRMRFEVLLRDARIEQLEAIGNGADPAAAAGRYEARKAQLAADFAFVADCNLGGEFMAPDKVERLKQIAEQTWQRHYDDRSGLPYEELKRYSGEPEPLPATEKLLADKPHHVIPRTDLRAVDPKWGFQVKVPDNLYNYGEVYNLSVGRGTLTEEERFKINEHVMQSLIMLEQLPLPKSMRRIPEYAGTHHETLIGTGYPRKLTATELSIPMRIMAIADVFEALTASDRPYKKAKTLSESIKILSFFKKDKHIDPDLFDLFLTSGVYRRYAEKFLLPEQIDEVDIGKYIG